MTATSPEFWLFFAAVFALYYLPPLRRRGAWQNLLLFAASWAFYAWVDWKMLPLLAGATTVYYGLGLLMGRCETDGKERAAVAVKVAGIVLGVCLLAGFKYLGLFTARSIVVPVGLSFFTFKLISYVLEIGRGRIDPCRNFISFALYVSFFPTILSGPIDRPQKFLPQLRKGRGFDYDLAVEGCRQVLWGLFTKMCIADSLVSLTSAVWTGALPPFTMLVALLLYPLQMYADFDGYSNMAIGLAKILGLRVARNFDHPLLGRNIAEYWRRWHISLTGWLTDYVFTPLNLALRGWGKAGTVLSSIVTFVLIGMWHGASWTFVLFGLYHGILLSLLVLTGRSGKSRTDWKERRLPPSGDFFRMVLTYLLVAFGLLFFQASSLQEISAILSRMAVPELAQIRAGLSAMKPYGIHFVIPFFLPVLLVCEWVFRDREFPLQFRPDSGLGKRPALRFVLYIVIILVIFLFQGTDTRFIYFKF